MTGAGTLEACCWPRVFVAHLGKKLLALAKECEGQLGGTAAREVCCLPVLVTHNAVHVCDGARC